jgi:hypothetical protein
MWDLRIVRLAVARERRPGGGNAARQVVGDRAAIRCADRINGFEDEWYVEGVEGPPTRRASMEPISPPITTSWS